MNRVIHLIAVSICLLNGYICNLDILTGSLSISVSQAQCLGTFEEFAYTRFLGGPEPIFPLPPWEEIVPTLSGITDDERLVSLTPQLSRLLNGDPEIWFIGTLQSLIDFRWRTFASRYQPISGNWDEFTTTIQNTNVEIDSLILSGDGTIWGFPSLIHLPGVNDGTYLLELTEVPSFLAKFDEPTGQFVSVGLEDISTQNGDSSNEPHIVITSVQQIAVPHGTFVWQFIDHQGVYRYNSESRTIIQVVDLTGVQVNEAFLGIDENLYYTAILEGGERGVADIHVRQIVPTNFAQTTINTPSIDSFGRSFGVLFDEQGRLWLGAAGYHEHNGNWIRISPFVNDGVVLFPTLSFSSSDGRLWYLGTPDFLPNGATWFDPDAGESCVFTNRSDTNQRFLEDSNRDLWFNIGGRIFRLQLDD